ncbi:hypothetical protein LCGC14_2069630 [marine sediment metagenome]|uniref:Uncharacterized protein n=1 Tax=marine sediment metagenome TaxID=412755 RepID=A0A0F9EIN8_9ZZZZ
MNAILQKFARQDILDGLKRCTEKQQNLFKRLYGSGENEKEKLTLPIKEVVEKMPEEKLDWAMQQVAATVVNNKTNAT